MADVKPNTVSISGIGNCPVTGILANQATMYCTLPPGAGVSIPFTINVTGQAVTSTGSTALSYAAPVILRFSPTNGPVIGTVLTGSIPLVAICFCAHSMVQFLG